MITKQSIEQWKPATFEEMTQAMVKNKRLTELGPRCHFRKLNDQVGGCWRDGVVISGMPGDGKSIFACHLALSFAMSGHTVIYVDLENNRTDIMERVLLIFLSMLKDAQAPTKQQLYSNLQYLAKPEIIRDFGNFLEDRLTVVDSSTQDSLTSESFTQWIEERIEEVQAKTKQIVFFLDSITELNLLYPRVRSDNFQSSERWLAALKRIRAKYEIPMFLISHVAKSADKMDVRFQPKGTTSQGHFARTQIIIEAIEGESAIWVKVVRAQFGETGMTKMLFDRTRLWLREE